MRINPLSLHRFDNIDRVLYAGRINFTSLVKHRTMQANQIDSVLRQLPGFTLQVLAILRKWTVHRPESHCFARLAVDEVAIFRSDESVLAGEFFIE